MEATTVDTTSEVEAIISEEHCRFRPIYVVGVWEDEREEKRATVATHMPSGSFERGREYDLQSGPDRLTPELTYVWPKCMTDHSFLHKAEIDGYKTRTVKHHPRIISVWPFLRKFRSHSDHRITSKCIIPLPFAVKSDVIQN